MSPAHIELILEQHGISPEHWPAIKALALTGNRPATELRTRLLYVQNYKAALDEILAELSKQVKHKFPPPVHHTSLEVA